MHILPKNKSNLLVKSTIMLDFVCVKALILFLMLSFTHCASATENLPVPSNPLFKLVLKDQNNQDLPLAQYQGKTFLLNFIYTTCGSTCPLQTRQLVEVQKKIPKAKYQSIQFLSITVDPQHDTPAVLKTYAKSMGADLTNWAFVSGSEQTISAIVKQLHINDPRKTNPTPEDHNNQLYLYGKNGLLMQRYNGDPVDVPRLAREILELEGLIK